MADLKRGRRPKAPEDVKCVSFKLMLTQAEYDLLNQCAEHFKWSKAKVLIKGLECMRDAMNEEKNNG